MKRPAGSTRWLAAVGALALCVLMIDLSPARAAPPWQSSRSEEEANSKSSPPAEKRPQAPAPSPVITRLEQQPAWSPGRPGTSPRQEPAPAAAPDRGPGRVFAPPAVPYLGKPVIGGTAGQGTSAPWRPSQPVTIERRPGLGLPGYQRMNVGVPSSAPKESGSAPAQPIIGTVRSRLREETPSRPPTLLPWRPSSEGQPQESANPVRSGVPRLEPEKQSRQTVGAPNANFRLRQDSAGGEAGLESKPRLPVAPAARVSPQPASQQERERDKIGTTRPQFSRVAIPEAERRAGPARPALAGPSFANRFREAVREQNRAVRAQPQSFARPDKVQPEDVKAFRGRITSDNIRINFTRLENRFGAPGHYYAIRPRGHGDFPAGYRDGYRDGFRDGVRAPRRHTVFNISFFYGNYYADPYWELFWLPGYYPSIYHYYGWFPRWIQPERAVVVPVDYIYVPSGPYTYYYAQTLDREGVAQAQRDLSRAWLEGDIDVLSRHLRDDLQVRVYFDGEYKYSISTEDYAEMTLDVMATTRTLKLYLDDPIWLSTHEVFFTGRHVYADPEGEQHTMYISYRLRRIGGEWYIVAVGSSLEPIGHDYVDFRQQARSAVGVSYVG